MHCRFCKTKLEHEFIDLINAPASNSFLRKEQLNEPETYYPLKVMVCHSCFLVQVDEFKSSESIFNNEYVYFSSYSTTWLAHAKKYVEMVTERFGLGTQSSVMEIASNDGYLLQYFLEKKIPVLGIEPTGNTAEVAIKKGIPTITEFFGTELANKLVKEGKQADLFLGNNVLAHVPDIVDLVKGMKIVLKPEGVITMEFPHLLQLVIHNQFDTIYHEHFSYLSLYTIQKIFAAQGLTIFDVEELPTHGGSLRIFAKHEENSRQPVTDQVEKILQKELKEGINNLEYYKNFQQRALHVKLDLLNFLIEQKKNGKRVAAYGAAAKGNTLLNYCGVKSDLIEFVVDANPNKQNKFLPASHIPVVNEAFLKQQQPDFVLILPWNIKEEIVKQLDYIRTWEGKFVTCIPALTVI
ncbi:SAM-dependent methyltransferase [Niastella yeongjuensis]|uniref:SAM-dependent methyltransferase n=1 Tax=Niastella yeongjuensis TaxID=354355 RepID=A0A1V9EXH0_9BACT|nr:class I SAM-dependent methyltransferase [Niastella yeongjuensis]OQP50813.1 SAM-dependent methyltransferase [Niastella yeongjuensis]SEN16408.1 Methyltransferase domain-containing protein [Niastella yeongjuensis]